MKRHKLLLFFAALLLAGFALPAIAEEITPRFSITVDPDQSVVNYFDVYHGETVLFEVTFKRPSNETMTFFWQEQGMGDSYWSERCTTVGDGVYRAVFTPQMDSGAKVFNCFIGRPGMIYRAVFQLRMKQSPGAVPNEIPLPAKVIDFNQITVLNAPWPTDDKMADEILRVLEERGVAGLDENEVRGIVTNTVDKSYVEGLGIQVDHEEISEEAVRDIAVEAVKGLYRKVDDEYVYTPTGYGDFEYEADEDRFPGLIDSIGNNQPYWYEYDPDYGEWSINFDYNGSYIYAYAYGSPKDPAFSLSGWYEQYNEEYGYWDYYEIYFTGKRKPLGYDVSNPRDTFAHQSEVNNIQAYVQTLRTTISKGESLRERTDAPREYGSGWGYLRKPLDSDFREWRIRAPKCTVSGLSMSSSYAQQRVFDIFGNSFNRYTVLTSPLTMLSSYAKGKATLTNTEGKFGSDSVELAHFDLGVIRVSPTDESRGFYVNFHAENRNRSPRSFDVMPILDGFDPPETIRVCSAGVTNEITVVGRNLYLPAASTTSSVYCYYPRTETASTYTYRELTSSFNRVYIEPKTFTSANGVIPIKFYVLSGSDCPEGSYGYNVKNVLRTYTATFSFSTVLDDYILPEGRVVTDLTSNLFYDEIKKMTYRIYVNDGCFYTGPISSKDWRITKDWEENP